MALDAEATRAVALLEQTRQVDNTVVIYTSENGWQMPRGLARCYDSLSSVPLAIRWVGRPATPTCSSSTAGRSATSTPRRSWTFSSHRNPHPTVHAEARRLTAGLIGLDPDDVAICSYSSEAYNLAALALRS